MTTPTDPTAVTPGMPSLTPADWAYLRSLGHTNTGTVYNAPVAGDFASVPFNQTYGGQPAPYRDLSTQILDAMRVPDTYTNSFPWNNGANRYNFGRNGQPATPPQAPQLQQAPMPQPPAVQPGLISGIPQQGGAPGMPPGGLLTGGGMGGAGAGTLSAPSGVPNIGGGMGGIAPGGFNDVAVRPPSAPPAHPGAPSVAGTGSHLAVQPKVGFAGGYTPQAQTDLTPQQYAGYQASAAQANANRQQFAGSMDARSYDPIAEMQALQNPLAQFAFYQGHPEYWQAFQQGPQMNQWINSIANSNDAKGVYWGADGTAHGLPATGGGK